jgi:EAL domain-containing protein (putative c-di-GMP-specific phosphodiesterase class I)
VDAVDVHVRAHVGLATAPWDGSAMSELVRRASISARRAADAGVPVMAWDGDREALTAADLELVGDLTGAAGRGELSLAYQPQMEATSRAMVAVEALLRWDSPVHGRVPPGRFVTLAERSGLIDGLTEWVVQEALDAQARWRQDGIDLSVSVNLSAKCLPTPGLADWILGQVASRGLATSCLTVEVTETAVADPTQALAVLEPLHAKGVRISVDDFGTGFTSLAQLPALPLDELKIDQCFVLRSATSSADEAIVHTIGELAHRLGLQVVAEGVETEVLAEGLTDMGIDILQGYHFARPMPEAELLALVRRTAGSGSWPKMIVPHHGPAASPSPAAPGHHTTV